jgi:hypothetical protein
MNQNQTSLKPTDAEQPSGKGLDEKTCSSRFSWRKTVGRWSQPTIYSLYKGKSATWLAIVQGTNAGLWFWYGGGRNTCATPTDLKSAKKEAMAHIKSILANA